MEDIAERLPRRAREQEHGADGHRTGLPVAQLLAPVVESGVWYAVTTVDGWGRLSDRSTIRYLGWEATQRVRMAMVDRIALVTKSAAGGDTLTKQGHLRVPPWIRRVYHLTAGSRILMVASRDHGLCALYPAVVLDDVLSAYHDQRSSEVRHAGR